MRHSILQSFRVSVLLTALLLSVSLNAQYYYDYGLSNDGAVEVSVTSTAYVIDYNLDVNDIVETFHTVNNDLYSTLDLPYSYMYDYVDSLGKPMLPVRHVYLQVPPNFDANLDFSNITFVYDYYDLKHSYYPYQEIWTDSVVDFAYDETEYLTAPDWTNDNVVSISSLNYFFDEKGFCVTIHPYSYDPIHERIRIIRSMSATIPISVQYTINQLTFSTIKDYIGYIRDLEIHPIGNESKRILMVTPECLVDSLSSYIAYREAQHHAVTIITKEEIAHLNDVNVNEVTPSMIINRLLYYYDIYWPRPGYVILVGEKSLIPYASGVAYDVNDPPSDYGYSLPIEYENPKGLRLRLSVGRWPIDTHGWRIKRLIDNIVKFESMIDDSIGKSVLPADFISGIDYDGNSDFFYNVAYNASKLLAQYYVRFYDGRLYFPPYSYIVQTALRNDINNGLWMLVYIGHGFENGFGYPLGTNFNTIHSYENELPPIVFAFACNTNAENFGQEWVSDYMGCYSNAISYFGSTTRECITCDRNYINNIFRNISHFHIGDILVAGAQKAFSDQTAYTDINTIKRYVFLGDPVLHLHGATFFGSGLQFSPQRQIENTFENLKNEKCNYEVLHDTYVYNINGQLILQFESNASLTNLPLQLPSGIYFVVRNVEGKNIIEKISVP